MTSYHSHNVTAHFAKNVTFRNDILEFHILLTSANRRREEHEQSPSGVCKMSSAEQNQIQEGEGGNVADRRYSETDACAKKGAQKSDRPVTPETEDTCYEDSELGKFVCSPLKK